MRNSPYCPGASPAMRLGAMPRRDQKSLSTSDSVANLARAPDFQHCPVIDSSTHYQTQVMEIPDRLKELTITRSCDRHRCQISNTVPENYWEHLAGWKDSRSSPGASPAIRLGAMPRRDQGALQHQTMLTTWHGGQIFNIVQSKYLECLTGWRASWSSPGASPAIRLGAMPRRDQGALQHQTMLTTWHGRQISNTVWNWPNYLAH